MNTQFLKSSPTGFEKDIPAKIITNAVFNNSEDKPIEMISCPTTPLTGKDLDYKIRSKEDEAVCDYRKSILSSIERVIMVESESIKAKRKTDPRHIMFQIAERIDQYYTLVFYQCHKYSSEIFKANTPYNDSKLDWRDKIVCLLILDYLKSSPENTLDLSDNSDVIQLIITLCLSRKEIIKPNIYKLIQQQYNTKVKKINF